MRILLVALSFFLLGWVQLSAQDTIPETLQREVPSGSPVVLAGDTLFFIRTPMGAFSAADRARAMSERLEEIIRDRDFNPDSLEQFRLDQEVYISYKSRILAVIQPKDTLGTGAGTDEMAQQLLSLFKVELGKKAERFSVMKIIRDIGYTLIVIAVVILIIYLLNLVFRRILRWVQRKKDTLFRSIRINQYEFLTVEREYAIALGILKILRIFLIVITFFIAFPVIFALFPATEKITRRIIDLVWHPVRDILMGVVNYIPEMITIIIIYFVFRYLVRFFRYLAREIEQKALVIPGFHPDWAKPTFNLIRILLYAFMFIIIFPYLPGSDSPVFRGVSVFLGVLLSLGSTSLISNTIAGVVITYMRPYRIGDRIKMDDIVGTVTEKTLMITRIRTTKNEEVTVPNAKILTGYTINYTTPTEDEGLIIHTTVTIGYDAPWRQVHQLLITAATRTPGIIQEPPPFVLQTSLDDFYISYQINGYIRDARGILQIRSDLHQNIQDEFNRAGVEIMSPHYRAERDGNEITIPKNEAPGAGPVKE